MERRDPCFLDDEQRWSPRLQPLLYSVKEVEEDRHEMFLPKRHQVGHLEDLEPALTQALGLSIEQVPEWAAQSVVGEALPQLHVLQVEQSLDPLLGPSTVVTPVNGRQRSEGQASLVVAGDVVVLGPTGVREHVRRVVLIEEKDLGARVAEELCDQQAD